MTPAEVAEWQAKLRALRAERERVINGPHS